MIIATSCQLLMHPIAASSPPAETPSAPEITLSNEEAFALAPESTTLTGVIKAQVVVRADHIRKNII